MNDENPVTPATPADIEQIATLVKSAKIGMLTTVDAEGRLVSRPLGVQETDFDGELWFFTQDPSPKVDDIRANPAVNVAFEAKKGYLSVAGSASIVHDRAKIDALWSTSAEAWFPEGKDDSTVALIKVVAESVELWTTDDSKPVVLLKVAAAAIRGGQPDIGENRTVTFD
ncbi:pyridoxamine 5'-phosphate oxidase family protein [Microbacteriaceae bacterium VKM Ac-2855]|nr:pyridoxamine 5'-phosphate oxidase family protein [Microbacteriaceae bacterium VKM Ac-2855]